MLNALKLLLYPLALPLLYIGSVATMLTTMFKRAEWGIYLLVALIPIPTLWYKLHDYPFGKDVIDFLFLSILLGVFINKNGFEKIGHSSIIVLYIAISYIALWNTSLRFGLPAPISTSNDLLFPWKNYAEMIFLYLLIMNGIKSEEQQKIVVVIIAIIFLLIGVREFRNFSGGVSFNYESRAEGPFWIVGLGANHLGAFMAHYGAALGGLFLIDKHKRRKWLYLAAIIFGLHPLFFAFSRGAYLGAFAAVLFYGLFVKRKLLVGLAVFLIFWNVLLPVSVVDRISMTQTSSGQLEGSAASRLDLWDHAISLFQENPIFGVGFGGFTLSVEEGKLSDTHNFYLKTLSEQGVIGITLLLIILFKALRSGWYLYQTGSSDFHRGLGLGFMGCIVAIIITNVFGDRWSYFVLGSYFWILWGLVDRAIIITNDTTKVPEEENIIKNNLIE